MGFALWTDGELAWAQGTHEYRPMGVAVISATDLFRPRDFDARALPRSGKDFAGLFASLEQVNRHLRARRSPAAQGRPAGGSKRVLATI